MREAIAIGLYNGKMVPVLNLFGSVEMVSARIHERKEDGVAFPDEQMVRIPRRLTVNPFRCLGINQPYFITA